MRRRADQSSQRRSVTATDPICDREEFLPLQWRAASDVLDGHRTRPLWYGALYRETLRCPVRLVTITRTGTIDRVPAYVLLVSTPDN
ncbi:MULTISPECIES: hypothetical protein [Paraburkholderia]|uniref:Uncharacterized protein n=1 Tax=Paraburkholderia madseniana TaxID=2599607 RepID=A0AAP5F0A0_9BURK|nr:MULTISPECIES: hypothetical protein [Paraburkholderia]MCX4151954.1 hypothetical protein [Paraburkholderia madseniana]MDN7154882.1 hypothetical protein [Paraburkholderia sp. WS6]MDQ6413765.1 hypothetical protein [Paraburkholderia madseniana]